MNHDEILQRIGKELELTPSKLDDLEKNYNALASFIDNNHSLSDKEGKIFTQGSFAIDTAIKPLKKDDFDVDMVVLFGDDFIPGMHVTTFYDQLVDVFRDSRYRDMYEEHKNVIRINYSNDYHFDIMPALINPNKKDGHIKCVNTKKSKWEDRAPKLYRDWFIEKSGHPDFTFSGNYPFQFRDMQIDVLEKPKPLYMKSILTRTIQLVKRARDVFFQDYEDEIPQSIVITTIIANLYKNEVSVKQLLIRCAYHFLDLVEKTKIKVVNPVKDIEENFTSKWDENENYRLNFNKFAYWFHYKMLSILHNDNQDDVSFHITTTFGKNMIDKLKNDNFSLDQFSSYWKHKERLKSDVSVEQEFGYELNFSYSIKILATYKRQGQMERTFSRNVKNFVIYPNAELTFVLQDTSHIEGDFKYIWRTRNMVSNYDDHPVRGDIHEEDYLHETTDFRGEHFVECYLIQYNQIIAYDRVNIEIM